MSGGRETYLWRPNKVILDGEGALVLKYLLVDKVGRGEGKASSGAASAITLRLIAKIKT